MSAVGLVCKFTTEVLERDRGGIELFSPIARHRLLAPSFVDIGNYQLEKKNALNAVYILLNEAKQTFYHS